MSTRVLDLDDVGTPVSRDDDGDDGDTDAASARRASASPASTSKRRRTRDEDEFSTACAFFLRGRCASGDACPRAHVRASATHAMNCGCPRCRPRRADDDGASESEDESEEGAVPRAVVAREAEERLDRRAAIIAECAVVSTPRAVTFWREFLRRAATEEGNKLTPYWTPRRADADAAPGQT